MLKEIYFAQVNKYEIFYIKCIFVCVHTHDKGREGLQVQHDESVLKMLPRTRQWCFGDSD